MVDRVGQQFGNYRIIRLLGEGGFAEVYLGEHLHLDTQAAIKVLHTQLTSDDVEQFRSEARTIARLEHPNIIRVLDFGIEGKTPYLVMSYAPNGTLRQYHGKGVSLPLATVVSYVRQVANALPQQLPLILFQQADFRVVRGIADPGRDLLIELRVHPAATGG